MATTDLITSAEYKAYTGIKSTEQDVAINAIISKVSDLVKTYCRRKFKDYVDEMKVETFNGGDYQYYLKEYPVISVVGVEYSTDYGQNYTDMVEFTEYVLDIQEEAITSLDSSGTFPKRINGYKVSYYGGYQTLPEDLKLAVFDLVTYYLKSEAISHYVRSPSSSTMQLEYITAATFPVHISRVLNLYKASWD